MKELILKKVENYIKEKNLIQPKEKVLLGVSGGADSVCLLCILEILAKKLDFQIGVLHVEHGIRGEASLEDAAFVQKLCEEKSILFWQKSFAIPKIAKERGLTEEEAGRHMRYQAFAEQMEREGYQKTAIAHNLNDNAETILFHLARGSAFAGLAGIAVRRDAFIRPLLCLERKEIEGFLQEIGQDYCTDQTNLELAYSRNRIRHKILPELEALNPKAVAHMGKTAEWIRQADRYFAKEAKALAEKCVKLEPEKARIEIEALKSQEPIIQSYLLMDLMEKIGGHRVDLTEKHLLEIQSLLEKQSGKSVDLPYEMKAIRSYGEIILQKKAEFEDRISEKDTGEKWKEEWELKMEEIDGHNVNLVTMKKENPYTKYIDYDKISGSLVLRTRQPEDYLILDKSGNKKSLRRYFIDHKIPAEEREKIWLLADGSHIVWILGDRLSYHYYLSEQTEKVLKIEIKRKKKRENNE